MLLSPDIESSIRDAHIKKEYRPVAVAIIQENNDKILFVLSAKNQQEWYLPQGGIHEDENVIGALLRELKEELDIEPEHVHLIAYVGQEDLDAPSARKEKRGFSKGKRYFFFLLKYQEDLKKSFTLKREELADYRWVEPKNIVEILSTARPEKKALITRWISKL